MESVYIGSRPLKVKKSDWKERDLKGGKEEGEGQEEFWGDVGVGVRKVGREGGREGGKEGRREGRRRRSWRRVIEKGTGRSVDEEG